MKKKVESKVEIKEELNSYDNCYHLPVIGDMF